MNPGRPEVAPMLSTLLAIPLFAVAGTAQAPSSLEPATTELGLDSPAPFMGPGCRIQQFYELAETGNPGGLITISALSLRFDGPTGGASAVGHSIDNLEIRVGATHRNVDQVGSVFADNLTQPLVTAFTASGYAWVSDVVKTATQQAWGGPNGQLRFQFPDPVAVVVPDGGCLVFEFEVRGNSNGAAIDPARLDFYVEAGAVTNSGSSTRSGFGCGATLDTDGQYEPGTAFFWRGDNYAPSMPVFTLLTANLLPLIWTIPGTPGCWLYVDLATGGVLQASTSDPGGGAGGPVPIPRAPQLCGAVIYLQNVGLTPRSPTNPTGAITSNYRTIEIGCTAPPMTRGWYVEDDTDPNAAVGTVSKAGGLALRIE